jgi:hydroxymethylpyrimidine pyrophosphatase-like HAD family hydrolase
MPELITDGFPVPESKLALFDIDGTLIDKDYRVTDDSIYGKMQEAQDADWTIGLSSDTPYEAMQLWRQRFGINGPIVAEKGALVEHNGGLLFDEKEVAAFLHARNRILDNLEQDGVRLWRGNPVEAIRENLRFGAPGDVVALVNTFRQCSLSFFVRTVNAEGELIINNELTERIVADARPLYPNYDDIEEDLNHDYGIVIASREANTKRAGSQRLLGILGTKDFAMVGNSITDYVGNDIAVHYAVEDSTPAYKEVADYIATAPLTAGTVEILSGLTTHGVHQTT